MTELGDNYRAKGQNDLLGAAFSAIDSDNDKSRSHCAKDSKSGWWFNNCSSLNLNAEWDAKTGRGIFWDNPKNQSKWNNLNLQRYLSVHIEVKNTPVFKNPTNKSDKYIVIS